MIKNRTLLLLLAPLLALGLLVAALGAVVRPAGAARPEAKWDDALRQAVAGAEPRDFLRVVAYLPQQQDPLALDLPAGRTARAAAVVETLRSLAEETQPEVRDALAALEQAGAVRRVRPLWIVNGVAFETTPQALTTLSARADVADVQLDTLFALPEVEPRTAALPPTPTVGIAAVGAPAAWHGLGIRGAGVTVALMDSGVDWTHPALTDSYRGRTAGGVVHSGSWYDAAEPANLVPFDQIGHGTHVAGLAVGNDGIGVAPDANWIAVKIADAQGRILTSVVLQAYQWLLAPSGNPALAPDIVNGSWGNPNGSTTSFLAGVNALRAAGIIQVYSAGNGGSLTSTVGAPASYPDTIAVGAHDDANQLAWFSSRGPSPLTAQAKPLLVAPGVRNLSSWPGGGYARLSGTSMAAPHTAGAIALLLAADPLLDEGAAVSILSATTHPLPGEVPNQNSGWGRLNAYAAVARALEGSQDRPGTVAIDVVDEGAPVSAVAVTVTTHSGFPLRFTTDGRGNLDVPLRAGSYQIGAARFGFAPALPQAVTVSSGVTSTVQVELNRLPAGTVSGAVQRGSDLTPVPFLNLEIDGVPQRVVTDGRGRFQVPLPAGTYTVRTLDAGSSIVTQSFAVSAAATSTITLAVESIPRILLVDGGGFLYSDTGHYFATALRDNHLGYDWWPLTDPFFGHPPVDVLSAYDTVIWSAPNYAPEAGNTAYAFALYDYLAAGGQLLVSGQEVGRSAGTGIPQSTWWTEMLGARYIRGIAPPPQISGLANTPFAGLTPTLNGGDGADNQARIEVVEPQPGKLTVPLFQDGAANVSALHAGVCEPYEIVYFGFGLEGVGRRADRAALIAGAFDYFTAPSPASGVRVPLEPIDAFVLPGRYFTATVPIFNLGETVTDTFDLALEGAVWPATLLTTTLEVGPCQTAPTELQVQVPADVDLFPDQQLTLRIRSQNDPGLVLTYPITLRTPQKPVLLVDDDLFYDAEDVYQEALDAMGVAYDTWSTGWVNSDRGSPTSDFLAAYEVVLWFTGYDWYQPLAAAETDTVAEYLRQGGRLFLSSQDYLYYNQQRRLTGSYFSVAGYTESLTTTVAYGAGPLAGAESQMFYPPYQNNSDGIYPEDPADVQLWGDRGLPVGVQQGNGAWRTVFWAVPWEKMDTTARMETLGGVLRQLVDLGFTTWEVDRPVGPAGSRTYTLTLRNDGAHLRSLSISNTVPASLTVNAATVTGADYDPSSRTLSWTGLVTPGAPHQIAYQAIAVSGTAGSVANPVTIFDHDYGWATTATRRTWIDAPDLTSSFLTLSTEELPPGGGTFSATLVLRNDSPFVATAVTATLALPPPLEAVSGTLTGSAPGVEMGRDGPRWRGSVPAGGAVTITVGVRAGSAVGLDYIPITAYVQSTSTPVLLRPVWISILTHHRWLPLIDSGR